MSYKNAKDWTGQKFNRLTFISPTDKKVGRNIVWYCQCDCGRTTIAVPYLISTDKMKSCGCLRRERAAATGSARKGTSQGIRMSHADHRKTINAYERRRCQEPTYRLRRNISGIIRQSLSNYGNKKATSFLKAIRYTMSELREHLEKQFEPWMTWENHGRYDCNTWDDNDPATWAWQLDHIIPQSDLPYYSMEEDNFKTCWSLSNLRPLSAKQNLLDGSRRTRHSGF